MKISHELKMKIISNSCDKIKIEQCYNEIYIAGSIPIKIPSGKEISLTLDLSNNLNLLKECKKWMETVIDCSSVDMKIDIGYFTGLFPVEIDIMENVITFVADIFDSNNQNWKDWFVMEENENASE